VLLGEDGRVLAAQRPPGKLAAGKWEFPGGKIEAGETAEAALVRELREELGIEVIRSRRLLRFQHDYSDRRVILDVRIVEVFGGVAESREQQALRWLQPRDFEQLDALPTVAPILRALQLPADYVFTPPTIAVSSLIAALPSLPQAAWLRLRLPALGDAAYAAAAAEVLKAARCTGLRVMLDRDPQLVEQLDAAGWHATQARLDDYPDRPVSRERWFAASAHDHDSLRRAQRLGADCIVVGPINQTRSHPHASVLAWSGFSAVVSQADRPIYAIGGVGPEDLAKARAAGALGIAGISAYWTRSGLR
jgi:8-oxo-dGTP diphosphatase